jgi:hypothetical protein
MLNKQDTSSTLPLALSHVPAVAFAVQIHVGYQCHSLLQQLPFAAARGASWEPQSATDIVQSGACYAHQHGALIYPPPAAAAAAPHAVDPPESIAQPSVGRTATEPRVGVVLLLAAPPGTQPPAWGAEEGSQGSGHAEASATAGTAAVTRRCACVGEVRMPAELMHSAAQAVDLAEAWGDAQHAYHPAARSAVKQLLSYMAPWGLSFGFISTYLATWLAYCPPASREGGRTLLLSRAFLATDKEPDVSPLLAIGWLQSMAMRSADTDHTAACPGPLEAATPAAAASGGPSNPTGASRHPTGASGHPTGASGHTNSQPSDAEGGGSGGDCGPPADLRSVMDA